ncbi:hypothetical protein [Nostoc parmelioides]|uniref:Uncharacterized protein n=1 Tax=Nostoc parmelioides FACHB-3921 TaxID=2692909 RepID=A0ABR8BB23_9NOSO|nr:hypothetical protein [Nostoc parmelioides]MBD2251046.1 hypothetical protein [Nostoc parmelioides FACHB-3921]
MNKSQMLLYINVTGDGEDWGLGTGDESIQNTLREGKPTKFKIQNKVNVFPLHPYTLTPLNP